MPDILQRIFDRTTKTEGSDGCWVYAGCLNKAGYASVSFQGKTWLGHRAVAHTMKMLQAHWQCVTHTCGNRACLRPDHLTITDKRSVDIKRSQFAAEMVRQGKVKMTIRLPKRGSDEYGRRVVRWVTQEQAKKITLSRARKEYRCRICDASMGSHYIKQKFCSKACRLANYELAHPPQPLPPCKVCGKEMEFERPIGKRKVFCSPACRYQFKKGQVDAIRPPKKFRYLHCVVCAERYLRRYKHGVWTCGKSCAAVLSWRRQRSQCDVCGASAMAAKVDGMRICSPQCSATMAQRTTIVET